MPEYEYECSARAHHISSVTTTIAKRRDRIRCRARGCRHLAIQILRPGHGGILSGKIIWTATQAFGAKRGHSDERRADLESSMLENSLTSAEMDRGANQ